MESYNQEINKEWFDKLRNDMLNIKEALNNPLCGNLKQLVVDMYSDKAHFLYELLQNADDAKATEVEIELRDDGLLFTHNGTVRFTLSDPTPSVMEEDRETGRLGHINSIVAIGLSNKANQGATSEKKIGKFGLGFKAVYNYTNTPYIYDDPYCFKMDRDFIPELLEDRSLQQKGKTVFFLPFNIQEGNTSSSYDTLSGEILGISNVIPQLFLNHIEHIYWKCADEEGLISKQLVETYDCPFGWMSAGKYMIQCNKKEEHIILLSGNFDLSAYGIHAIKLAYWLNANGGIETSKRNPGLYSYFPLKQDFNTCYAAHAPFELTPNRERFKDSEFNHKLIRAIGCLAAHGLIALKEIGLARGSRLVDKNVFHLIDNNQSRTIKYQSYYRSNELVRDLDDESEEVLKKEALFTNRKGDYVTSSEVVWGNSDMQKLFDTEQVGALLGKSIDFADLPDLKSYLSLSGINKFDYNELAEKLSSKFLSVQDEGWLEKFYQFVLEKKLCENNSASLAKAPCIRVKSGKFVKLWTDAGMAELYFDDGSCISNDKLIDETLYNSCKPFKDLIDKVGIQKPNEMQKLLNRTERMSLDMYYKQGKELLADILVYIKNNSSQKGQELIKGLKDRQYKLACILVNEPGESLVRFMQYQCVFFDDGFSRAYFELSGLKRYFVCWDFYSEICCSKKGLTKDDFIKFLRDLGVKSRPGWVKESFDVLYKERDKYLRDFKIDSDSNSTSKWCDLESVRTIMEGLNEVFANLQSVDKAVGLKLSIYIWNLLCNDCRIAQNLGKPFPVPDKLLYLPTSRYKNYHSREIDKTLPLLRRQPWFLIGGEWLSIESGITRENLKGNGYVVDENLAVKLQIHKSSDAMSEEEKSTLSDVGRGKYELGEVAQQYGIHSGDEMKQALEYWRKKIEDDKKAEYERNERTRLSGESDYIPTTSYNPSPNTYIGQDRALTSRDFEPNDMPQQSSAVSPKRTYNYLSRDITKGFDDANLRFEDMEKMARFREQAASCEKYSYLWFKSCITLETMAHGRSEEEATTKRTVRIDFGKATCVTDREELIVLSDTPQHIPDFIEDIDDISVSFTLFNGDLQNVTFDVASVKDERLILKGSGKAKEFIANVRNGQICIVRARIDMEKPVEIIGKWKDAIYKLDFEDSSSLKDNLRDDLKFVFGPPGTGKTTKIATFIKEQMQIRKECRILVLAPTNKACDVLAEKIIDLSAEFNEWLWRFVSTMSISLEQDGFVHSRAEAIESMKRVCVVSTMARYAFDGFQYGKYQLKAIDWDYVVVDEASMMPLYQIVVPIFNIHTKKIIIAGDPFQIELIVKIDEWKGENIYTMVSLNDFSACTTEPKLFPVERLLTQYRSIPSVGNVYSQFSYGGQLKHRRTHDSRRTLNLGFKTEPLNIISFPVTSQSIFEPKRLAGSNIQIYSAVFAVEFLRYITKNIHEQNQDGRPVSIGVTGPYKAEIQTISKMYAECASIYADIDVVFGTSHGFQGDECDIVVVVANPPASGMVRAADKTFVNNKNILNVAISRARDCLFLLMPDRSYQHFDQMSTVKALGRIMSGAECKIYSSNDIEQLMLGSRIFIESNTFVTSHQTTNVYMKTNARYEVRIDENNIDITIH